MIDYDSKYIFRYADINDIEDLMRFLDENWRKEHILSKNRTLFEYEFLDDNGNVNFLMAIDKKKNSIEAIIGFLKTAYSNNITDIWTSLWKVKEGNMLFLGSELLKRLEADTKFRHTLSVGDNAETSARILKKKFGRYIVKMNHYYILSNRDIFKIAVVNNRKRNFQHSESNEDIEEIISAQAIDGILSYNNNRSTPLKDAGYYNKRFLNHPIYKYRIYKIERDDKTALFVTRDQFYEDRKVLRIVDYFGNNELIEDLGIWVRNKINTEDYEYADFLCYGFDPRFFEAGGFSLLEENDPNIIPDYFSPFEQRNIDILCDTPIEAVTICKADGDQDRPNMIV